MMMYISVATMLPTDVYVVRLFRMVSIPINNHNVYYILYNVYILFNGIGTI